MVAIITGAGLGLLDSTAYQLNGAGVGGNGKLGLSNGSSTVNLANGNLILQYLDETLSGTGADLLHMRTYNSQGVVAGDDRWRWLGEKRIVLQGSMNTAGSTVVRTTGDGHESIYAWNGSAYVSSDGNGADDAITFTNGEWLWVEGTTKASETYSAATGWITASRDTSGNGLNYTFSGDRLTRISDLVSGQTLELIYNANNRIARLDTKPSPTGVATQQVKYEYDNLGRLASVTTDLTLDNNFNDGDIFVTSYTYDGDSNRVSGVYQDSGNTYVTFSYINVGGTYKVQSVSNELGSTTFNYGNGYTEVTDGANRTTRYTYDLEQRLTQVSSAAVNGQIQKVDYQYDARDNVIKVVNGDGDAINYEYDANSNLIKEVDALGNTIVRTYADNLLVTETRYATPHASTPSDPETTRFVYDSARRLRFTVSAEGRVSENRYNTNGLISYSFQYGGLYSVGTLSASATLNETDLISFAGGQDLAKAQAVRYEYDLLGNLSRKYDFVYLDAEYPRDADMHTAYIYDEYGQLLQTALKRNIAGTEMATVLTSATYDGMGRLLSTFSEKGTSNYFYDARTIGKIDSETGLITTTHYNSEGKVLSSHQKAGDEIRTTNYSYDGSGRLQMVTSPDGGRSYIFYDAAGRISHKVSAEGAVIGYTYNKNGQVTEEKQYFTKADTSTWYANNTVNLSSITPATHVEDRSTRYAYDKSGRLTTTTEEFGSLDRVTTTSYDGAGRVVKVDVGGRATRYYYDKDGRQIGILNAELHLTEFVYDGVGRLVSKIRYDKSLTATASFADLKVGVASAPKLTSYYFYDVLGRQVGLVDEQGSFTETAYDVILGRGRHSYRTNEVYRYLTPVVVNVGDTLQQLRAKGGDKQTTRERFDLNGRLALSLEIAPDDSRISTTQYAYDTAGRLVFIQVGSAGEPVADTLRAYNAYGELVGEVDGEGADGTSAATINISIDQYGKRYEYDRMGRRIAEFGPEGQKTFLYYDKEGRLTYTVNALGEVSTTTYNTFGQITSVRILTERISTANLTGGTATAELMNRVNAAKNDASDQVVSTTYNLLGLVATSTDGEGKVTRNEYNKYGELTDVFRPAGNGMQTQQRFHYNALGQVIKTFNNLSNYDPLTAVSTAGLNLNKEVIYDGFGRVIQSYDERRILTVTDYLDNGRTVVTKDHATSPTRVETTTYGAFGRVASVVDAMGHTTTYSYDDSARSITVTSPEGIAITTWKGRNGQTLKVRDGNGNETNYAYNKDGQLLTVTDQTGKKVDNTYDRSGRLYETRDGNNNLIRFEYDASNRLVTKYVDPDSGGLNIRTRYEFDGQGRQITVINAFGSGNEQKVSYKFDRNGRIKHEVRDPDGLRLTTAYTYDDAGNTVRVGQGSSYLNGQALVFVEEQATVYVFDGVGRKTKEIVAPGTLDITTEYRYDKTGNLTRVIDANGNSTWYMYNRFNEKTMQISALGTVIAYQYDVNGRLSATLALSNSVPAATLAGWGDIVTGVAIGVSETDRRTYYVRDKDGRERFTVAAADTNKWVVTESIFDGNGNTIETRRYDNTLLNQSINSATANGSDAGTAITANEMIAALKGLGYRDTAWGDANINLANTRRSFFAYDAANRLRFSVDAEGYLTENVYDAVGNVRFQKSYANKPNSFNGNYSVYGISIQVVNNTAADRITEYRYDAANRLVDQLSSSVTVTASNNTPYTGKIKTHINYNALGQVSSRVEGIIERVSGADITIDQRTTSYEYDKAGRQTKTILAGWYDSTDGRVYQNKEGQADRFQRITEVLYDNLDNAVRNKITTGAGTFAYQYKAYDTAGRELFDVDAMGHVTGTTYDNLGNIKAQTRFSDAVKLTPKAGNGYWSATDITLASNGDTAKRTITHEYDVLGRKLYTFQPIVTNYYAAGDAATLQNPADSSGLYGSGRGHTHYEYNVFNEVVVQKELLDANRTTQTNIYYDRLGRQILVAQVENYSAQAGYSIYGAETTYDALGNIQSTREYANKLTTATLQADIKPVFVSSNTDRVQVFSYDALGRTLTVTRDNLKYVELVNGSWSLEKSGSAVMSRSVYNAFGEVVKQFDALGEAGRVAASEAVDTAASIYATRTDYDVLGRAIQVTTPAQQIAGAELDPFRNQASLESSPQAEMKFTYDVFGNVRATTQGKNGARGGTITTQAIYDHVGNQIQSVDGGGNSIQYRVDVNGRIITQSQVVSVNSGPLAYAHTVKRSFEYDAVGRQIVTLDHDGVSKTGSRQVYNAFGEVLREERIWGAEAQSTNALEDAIVNRYEYDSAGRIKLKQSSDGYTYYYYDLKGNLTRQVQAGVDNNTANARITENYYDLLGRIRVQRLPYSTGTETGARIDPMIRQEYDRWNNVSSRTDAANQTSTMTYNHDNQLVRETGPSVMIYTEENKSFRAAVNRTLSYDLLGRAAVETQTASGTVDGVVQVALKKKYQYFDRVGNITKTVDATGVTVDYAYDIHGNRIGMRNGVGAVTVYDYDNKGQLLQQSLLRQTDQVVTHQTQTSYGVSISSTSTERAYDGHNSAQTAGKKIVLNRFDYDQAGNKYAEFNSANKGEYYRFNAFGQIDRKQDIAGRQTQFSYDALGHRTGQQTLQSVMSSEVYVYGYTTTDTAGEGSTPNMGTREVAVLDTRQIQVRDGTRFVTELPDDATEYTPVTETTTRQVIYGYTETEVWGNRDVEYVYGYTTTTTAQRGSTEIWDTRLVQYQSGTQTVSSLPYGVSNYELVYGTRQVEYIDGYKTTTNSERGSTEIWDNRQVEYVYGYTTTAAAQRGSEAVYAQRQETYQSGWETVSSLPYGATNYTTVYGTRQVEYIDGYTTTSTSQRGSTEIWGTRQVEYVYGYTTTTTEQRGSTAIWSQRQEQYISHYTTGAYGVQTPVYATRTVDYISGYNTPIYATRTENYFTGTYKTPIYKTRNEQYVSGYQIPVYSTRTVTYIKEYKTPIYATRTENYFTGTYKTPVYKMRDEQYFIGYKIPVYSTKTESYFTGTYKTPIYATRTERYFIGIEKTPIYGTITETHIVGYDIPIYRTVDEEYIAGYTTEEYIINYQTPVYAERTVYVNEWVGNSQTYSNSDYAVDRVISSTVQTVDDNKVLESRIYNNSFTDFGELRREQSAANSSSFVEYDYHQNGLLKRKYDQENMGAGTQRVVESSYKYDIRGLRTVETHGNTDNTTRTSYGVTTTHSTVSNINTYYSYDELGRLASVRSPASMFNTGLGSKQTSALNALSYNYDAWGNRRAITSQIGTEAARTQLFAYDAEGRILVDSGNIDPVTKSLVVDKRGGTAYEYDAAGRLKTSQVYLGTTNAYGVTVTAVTEFTQTLTNYNDMGLVESVSQAIVTREGNAANHKAEGILGGYKEIKRSIYDARGFLITNVENNRKTESTYHDDGQLITQKTFDYLGRRASETVYKYTTNGELSGYEYKYFDAGSYKFTNNYHYEYTNTFTGSQVGSITVSSTQERTAQGTTINTYDHRGRLTHSQIEEANPDGDKTGMSHKYFAYNAEGQIISSVEKKFGSTTVKSQNYYYHNGSSIADIGDKGTNTRPINAQYAATSVPGTYTVSGGESLTAIAQRLFGDGSLWYVIAEANALSMGPTDAFSANDAGRNLRIPNTLQALKNNSTTFKPYNAGEAIGDLTPSPEILPPPKSDKGCGALGMIIMIVVAVVVTVVTAGAAAAAMGAAATATGATTAAAIGGAALAGGSGLALTAGTMAAAMGTIGTAMAAAAVGGFVGSLASQAVGMAMGMNDGISLRSAFSSGLTAGFGAGAAGYLSSTGAFGVDSVDKAGNAIKIGKGYANAGSTVRQLSSAGLFAQGATSYMASVGSNKIAGLNANFNWTDMAVASLSSGITGKTGNNVTDSVSGLSNDFIGNFAGNMWGSGVSSSLSRLAGRGDKQDWNTIAADAFGNASASWVVQQLNKPKPAPKIDSRDTLLKKKTNDFSPSLALPLSNADGELTPLQQNELKTEQAKGNGSRDASSHVEQSLSEAESSSISSIGNADTDREAYLARNKKGILQARDDRGRYTQNPLEVFNDGIPRQRNSVEGGVSFTLIDKELWTTNGGREWVSAIDQGSFLDGDFEYRLGGAVFESKATISSKFNLDLNNFDFDLTLIDFEAGATVSYAQAKLKTDYGTLTTDAKSAAHAELALAVQWDSSKKSAKLGGSVEAALLQLSLGGQTKKMSFLNDIFDVNINAGGKLNIGAAGLTGYVDTQLKNDKLRFKTGLGLSALVGLRGEFQTDIQFNRKAFNQTLVTLQKQYPIVNSYIEKASDMIESLNTKLQPKW